MPLSHDGNVRSFRPGRSKSYSYTAFTLVELLVVIAIIGVLVALLLPAIQAAREAARRSQCTNNLRQIAIGALDYESAKGHFPAGSTVRSTSLDNMSIGGPYYSTWTVDILPFVEQGPLHDVWDPTVGFSHPTNQRNRQLRETFLPLYLCPSDTNISELGQPESGPGSGNNNIWWAPGSYRAVSGQSLGRNGDHYWDNPLAQLRAHEAAMPDWARGIMYCVVGGAGSSRGLKPVKISQILDGTSNTLLVGEYHTETYQSRRSFWAYAYTSYNQSSGFVESRTLIADYVRCQEFGGGGEHTCKRAWGSLHAAGVIQFAYGDASVRSVTPDVDINAFAKWASIADEGRDLSTQVTPPRGR